MNFAAAMFLTGIILFAVGRWAITTNPREANGWLIFLGGLIALGFIVN